LFDPTDEGFWSISCHNDIRSVQDLDSLQINPIWIQTGELRCRADSRYAFHLEDAINALLTNVESGAHNWREAPAAHSSSYEAVLQAYASMSPDMAIDHLQASQDGLTQEEAVARLKMTGPNILSTKKPPTWWQLALSALPNPFNILLALLAIISVATPPAQWSTFTLLVVMIVISCVVRFWQEYRSTVAAVKLQAGVSTNVRVRRQVQENHTEDLIVDEKTLVPGDILLVDPGDALPADCMALETYNLSISQSRSVDTKWRCYSC
jgi:Mg2+-importing ATPase